MEAAADLVLVYLDSDRHPDVVSHYGIVDLPTLIFLTPEGGVISRVENEFRDRAVEQLLEAVKTAGARWQTIQANEDRWKRRLATAPDDLEAHQRLGAFYYGLKLNDRARPHLDRVTELDPQVKSRDSVHAFLCAVFLNLNPAGYERGRAQAEAFLTAQPAHPEAAQMAYYHGVTLFHTGGYARAREVWQGIVGKYAGTEWAKKATAALELPEPSKKD